MAILKVAAMGNPVLRAKAKPVPENEIGSAKINQLIADMVETMHEYNGRGLAAPQVHESLQIVVMLWDFDEGKKPHILVLINPSIKPLTDKKDAYWEGCLSLPGLIGKVARPNKIAVSALSPKKEKINFVAEGFCATVVQHECDHLDGTLYVDRIENKTELAFTKEYQRYLAHEGEVADEG